MSFLTLVLTCLFLFMESHADELRDIQDNAREFGKTEMLHAIKQMDNLAAEDLIPIEEKGKTFDAEQAKRSIKEAQFESTEIGNFLTDREVLKNERSNRNFHDDEYFLKRSAEIADSANGQSITVVEDNTNDFVIEKCQLLGGLTTISGIRNLQVNVGKEVQKRRIKKCKGHLRKLKKKARKALKNDPTVRSVQQIQKLTAWSHIDDALTCDHFIIEEIDQEIVAELNEEWVFEDKQFHDLINSPEATFMEQKCLDADSTRIIHGKEVKRKCWKEQLTYLYEQPKIDKCCFLKNKNCEQIGKKCLNEGPLGCTQWELTFKCYTQSNKKSVTGTQDIHGLDSTPWKTEIPTNNSFPDVVAKLSVFEAIKKDMEQNQMNDPSKLSVFMGKKMKCNKNIADNILYDCCFKNSGMALKLGVSKCSSDELGLADMREKGLCHYVGSYEKTSLGIKTGDVHVFCCFSSKLARILQEEAKKQLTGQWGKPKKEKCVGISINDLANLDFSKMDFSDLFEEQVSKMPDDFQEKLKAFQNKISEKVKNEEKK